MDHDSQLNSSGLFATAAPSKLDGDSAMLERAQTSGTVVISSELFEKLYLSPQNVVKHGLRQTFANPSPLGLAGFLVTLSPLTNVLMGWRGAGGGGAANIGTYYFFGGMLLILTCVMEFILGNTFPMVVFGTLGAFFLTFGATLTPFYNATAAYQQHSPSTVGGINPEFAATFANGKLELSNTLMTTAGALGFVNALAGWYLFTALILESVDFPYQLPVGDLSHIVKGRRAGEQ
ncbi:hypothetical protein MHUMG1_10597 [Metarhizium humberi]|uniref:Uncharacterized protein n=1 Tax=Metarhizium humberi TaxID=2596975 RepID=A0A9P8M1A2_9HYPO|nr:hypothetical protein MHUMG1_10597 [Metarhizium humberi]